MTSPVAPKCPRCGDGGMVSEAQEYPWGGFDALLVFCDCPVGKRDEDDCLRHHLGEAANKDERAKS